MQSVKRRFSPASTLTITIGGIVLAEVIAMVVIYYLDGLSYVQQVVIDAAIMTVIITPWLYTLLFKPLIRQIGQRQRAESILQARLRLMQFANAHPLDELLQLALDEIESLTASRIGFFHFLEADRRTLSLQAWSTNTRRELCQAEPKDSHYAIDRAGVWADAVRLRRPVIHNDYEALPGRQGLPEGHPPVFRELVVPVLRKGEVVAILGVGNKPEDYTSADLEITSTFADFAWDIIERKRAENALRQSEEKFRTLMDWTYDWEMWVDSQGAIVYTTPSCERITGYKPEELIANPDLRYSTVHPADQAAFLEHLHCVHDAQQAQSATEFRMISRGGNELWIEHICRPLFSPEGRYLGRRVSSRDITQRKQAEKKIHEQNLKEVALNRSIQTIQTDLARDLHDTLGQNIGFLRMNLDDLAGTDWSDPQPLQGRLQAMTAVADESYELIRTMLAFLRSGSAADPLTLFTRYANEVAERSHLQIDISSNGRPAALSNDQTRQLLYIFREALSNIEKYAQATRVEGVFTWEDGSLGLTIRDDGRGFDPHKAQANGHYGLVFMQERAELLNGCFSIQSAPGQGTQIEFVMPYQPEPAL